VLVAPSPKVQDQEVGLPVEASVKATDVPTAGALGEKVKTEVGAGVVAEDPPPQPRNANIPSVIPEARMRRIGCMNPPVNCQREG
jgi:hypothetical protein